MSCSTRKKPSSLKSTSLKSTIRSSTQSRSLSRELVAQQVHRDECTVHVTSYLKFSVTFCSFLSWNSLNVCKIFYSVRTQSADWPWERITEHFPQKTASCEWRVRAFTPLAIYELRTYHESIHVRYSVPLFWMCCTWKEETQSVSDTP